MSDSRGHIVRRYARVAAVALVATAAPCSPAPAAAPAAAAWQVPGTPPVATQRIVFSHAGATLAGVLYRPVVDRPVPAVVVLHGASSGKASDHLYDHLRTGLPAMGVAVLIYDRRGEGASTGPLKNIDYPTLAGDGVAGARALAKLPSIDPARIGYWGLSQGGWLSVLAASLDPHAAFAISVSAPLVTPELQMEFAMSNHLSLLGYPQSDVDAMLAARKAWTGYLAGTAPRSAAVAALAAIQNKPWFGLMYLPSAAELTANPSTSSWRKEMNEDMLAAVRAVRVPALFIYGGSDPWIPVASTVAALKRLARVQKNIQYAVIAHASHEMMVVPNERMELSPLAAPQSAAYFMLLGSWLRGVLDAK
ncbi:MAG TPA: alpha/beta fold hydrolase [Candidatus Cybelea sp.]|nr:alpha/beta fold hydrolase [Candidatus Cybelea sp.]